MGKKLLGSLELNRVYQMDCLEGMKLIPDKSIDLILTDIPYEDVTHHGAERAKYKGQLRNLDKGKADVLTFELEEFLDLCYKITRGTIYIFCSPKQVSEILKWFEDKKDVTVRQCIWHKSNPSPANGQYYWLNSFENCVFIKKRKTAFNQRCKHNVWEFPCGRSKTHPTEKPLKLFEYLLLSSTNENDIVLDTCMGSGTTAVAALKNNRNFIGFETEPKYIELINKRIESAYSEIDDNKLLNMVDKRQ